MKICPKCQKEHEKPGTYCSYICANRRAFSPETTKKQALGVKEYYKKNPGASVQQAKGARKYWQDYKAGKLGVRTYDSTNCQRGLKATTLEKFKQGKLVRRGRIYLVLVSLHGNKCALCPQIGEWNGKPLRLRVDHADGNATNNLPINLRLVCPNCDSQLSTYAGGNRGFGRQARGLRIDD